MAKMSNILTAFAIAFLASLSLSSAFTEHNLDTSDTFERHLDHELQPLPREKREKQAEVFQLTNDNSLELEEELPEPKSINERSAIGEEDGGKNEKSEKPITESKRSIEEKETAEEDAQDNVLSYRTMHDLIKTLIEADEEDITEKLQQLRETENAESEKLSNLPKRQAVASAAAAASSSSSLLGANPWDAIPLDDLDAHSCETEAFSHGHSHVSGTLVHEFGCELRKSWHYGRLVLRNLNSGLSLGPLIAGGEVISGGLFHQFCHRTSHLFHAVIREPHHLLILPDIIRDAVPFTSITGAFHRLKHVFFRVVHFGLDLCRGHVRHVFRHLFSHGHHLKEKLHHHLHHLHHSRKFGSILPLEGIVAEPVVSTVTSAAATATATATAAASSDSSIVAPDYHTSLAEVLSSFRGFYDGYHASGIPHLIGTSGISVSSAFSRIGSYLSGLPFFNQFGWGPVEQSTTVTATSAASASSSVGIGGGPAISSIIEPTIVSAPIIPIQAESVSSSASATATATATIAETQPVFSAGPAIVPSVIPCEPSFAGETATAAAAATATATATATAVEASPIVSDFPTASLIPPVPTLSPAFVPVAAPEFVVPNVLEDNVVAAASAAASSGVVSTPIVGRVPHIRPLHKHKARPFLSTGAPAVATATAAAAASSVADVVSTPIVGRVPHIRPLHKHRLRPVLSAGAPAFTGGLYGPDQYRGLDLDIDRRIRYPLNRLPAGIPPSAASSAAAASAGTASAAASSSASSVSSGGFNFALPRQHIVDALGYDYLLPGDIITVTLRNKSTLFGRILDATSPVTFDFLRPKMRASLLRHGGRLWNLLPRDFRDPECYRKFNDPLLLRHGL